MIHSYFRWCGDCFTHGKELTGKQAKRDDVPLKQGYGGTSSAALRCDPLGQSSSDPMIVRASIQCPSSVLEAAEIYSPTEPQVDPFALPHQGVSEKLGTLIEGESLLNDGSAIVVFEVFLGKYSTLPPRFV